MKISMLFLALMFNCVSLASVNASVVDAYWEIGGSRITNDMNYAENLEICLVATTTSQEQITFKIYEKDTFSADDLHRTITLQSNEYSNGIGKACGAWLSNSADYEYGDPEYYFVAETTVNSVENPICITSTPAEANPGFFISNSGSSYGGIASTFQFASTSYYITNSGAAVSFADPRDIDLDLKNVSVAEFKNQISNVISTYSIANSIWNVMSTSGISGKLVATAEGALSYVGLPHVPSQVDITNLLLGQFYANIEGTYGKGLILAPKLVSGPCQFPVTFLVEPGGFYSNHNNSIRAKILHNGVERTISLALVNNVTEYSYPRVVPAGIVQVPPGLDTVLILRPNPMNNELLFTDPGTYEISLVYDEYLSGEKVLDEAVVEVLQGSAQRPSTVSDLILLDDSPSSSVSFNSSISELRWHVSPSGGSSNGYPVNETGSNLSTVPSSVIADEGVVYSIFGDCKYPGGAKVRFQAEFTKCFDGYYLGNKQCGTPPAMSVAVTTPNGGESARQSESLTITWNSLNLAANDTVKIELLNGAQVTTLSASTANDGTYTWYLPSNQTTGTNFKIKISATTNSSVSDTSDSSFTILPKEAPLPDPKEVQVISPNGGETLVPGYTYTIEWEYNKSDTNYFNIALFKDGQVAKVLSGANNSLASRRSYSWDIPVNDSSVITGGNYKIKISTMYDGWDDQSDSSFSIAESPTVTVLSPNGGETYDIGQVVTIRWSIDNLATSDVEIKIKNDENGVVASFTAPNVGYYNYTIPDYFVGSDTYTVKVNASGSGMHRDVYDYSDDDFTIVEAVVIESLTLGGPDSIDESSTAVYSATAHYNDGTSRDVTYSAAWTATAPHAFTYNNGELNSSWVNTSQTIQIGASYDGMTTSKEVVVNNVFGEISGMVLAPDSKPLTGKINQMYVTVYSGMSCEDLTFIEQSTINNDGSYSLGPLLEGTYYIQHSGSGLSDGWYTPTGVVSTCAESESLLLSSGQTYDDVNITWKIYGTVSGSVMLPGGILAGNDIPVQVTTLITSGFSSVIIPAGQNSVAYTIPLLLENQTFSIGYNLMPSLTGYMSNGLFGENGMVWSASQSTMFNSSNIYENIDLILMAANTISGTISLPGSDIAPSGGVYIQVSALDQNGSEPYAYFSTTIPEGESSEAYTLTVPSDASSQFQIHYDYWQGNSYLRKGYYSTTGTQWNSNLATTLSGGTDYSTIDLTLLTGNTISGTIALPGVDIAPPGGVYIQVSALDQNGSGAYAYFSTTIPEGESSTAYMLTVPSDANANFQINYDYWQDNSYLRDGYYSTTGTQWNSNLATTLSGGTDYSTIDLTLLTGNTISGTISLPGSDIAPPGGMDIQVSALDQNGSGAYAYFYTAIPEGESSTAYMLTVPSDASANFQIYYDYWQDNSYLPSGYYSSAGTQWIASLATPLPGGTDCSTIDLILLTGNRISGTISLPGSDVAPPGGMGINVSALDQSISGSYAHFSTTIPEGESSTTYTLNVPPDANANFQIYYDYLGENSYFRTGYYSTTGTQWNSNLATTLSGETDYSTIDLTLITGNTINGTISLPGSDIAPPGGMYIQVGASDQNGSEAYAYFSTTIPEGESSTTYTLTIPSDTSTNFQIYYDYWQDNSYLSSGYYSSAGTQWTAGLATPLPGGTDYSTIDLTLLTGNRISGTISLPGSDIAPPGGMDIQVSASDQNGSGSFANFSITIPEGESSTAYTLHITPDASANLQVYYSCWQDNSYLKWGYYSTVGTQWNSKLATALSGGTDYSSIDLTLLTGNTISGTLSFPQGFSTTESLQVSMMLWGGDEYSDLSGHTNLQFDIGQSSVPFEVMVPADAGSVLLSYNSYFEIAGGYASQGYYSNAGTMSEKLRATLLDAADGASGLTVVFFKDADGDSLSDDEEASYGLDPNVKDSDNDGLKDGDEVYLFENYYTASWDGDIDGDGIFNIYETDMDNDGVSDLQELARGSDATDAGSLPPSLVLYDDFSTPSLNMEKWKTSQIIRETVSEELHLGLEATSSQQNSVSLRQASTAGAVKTWITLQPGAQKEAAGNYSAGLSGVYYSNVADAADSEGQLEVSLFLGDNDSGLKAWYEVSQSNNGNGSSWSELIVQPIAVSGTISLGATYCLETVFDGTNNFTFNVYTVNTGTSEEMLIGSASYAGPENLSTYESARLLKNRVKNGRMTAVFDNVRTGLPYSVYDDFSSLYLDQSKWNKPEYTIQVTDSGKARLVAHSVGGTVKSDLEFKEHYPYVEVVAVIEPKSWVAPKLSRSQLTGNFFNDSRGPNSGKPYNGTESDIDGTVSIYKRVDSSDPYALVWVDKSLNNDWSSITSFLDEEMEMSFEKNRKYKLFMGVTGDYYVLGIEDLENQPYPKTEAFIYPITSGRYLPSKIWTAIRSRVDSYGGEVGFHVTTYDDVYVGGNKFDIAEGDVSADDVVDLKDLILTLQVLTGENGLDIWTHGDTNDDAVISLPEVISIMNQMTAP
jgi:hypothetical protein